jgi:transposase
MTPAEVSEVHRRLDARETPPAMRKRLKVVLMSSQGWNVPDLGYKVDLHVNSIRKWIRRFNEGGLEGLEDLPKPGNRNAKIALETKREIVRIATSRPEDLGQPFTSWSLPRLRRYLVAGRIVPSISVEWLRQILRAHGIRKLRTRTWMGSTDPDFLLKKRGSRGSSSTRRRTARS